MNNTIGLDLGTNSIGWAVIDKEEHRIKGAGSRILPIDAETLGAFEKGNTQSPMAERRNYRMTRRMIERSKLRRSRLHRALHVLGYLPAHYEQHIDFDRHPGEFSDTTEPLLPYRRLPDGSSEFIFKESFEEMLDDFRKSQPGLVADGRKVPHDWTLYYLRKKALTARISGEELAWILLNFNTKRGYYQLRGMDDSADEVSDNKEFRVLTVTAVEEKEPVKGKPHLHYYNLTYDNGATRTIVSATRPRQTGDRVEAICTTKTLKDGTVLTTVSEPDENDWTLRKKRTENEIARNGQTVGAYIYDHLLHLPDTKVRGKLVHTVERRFYRDELRRILLKQQELLPELTDRELLCRCADELYRENTPHAQSLQRKDWIYLLLDDLIFYQRPLKSQKGKIACCPFEQRSYVKRETGEIKLSGIPCLPQSHPLFQEFRLRQFISNLRIYQKEKLSDGRLLLDYGVTSEYLPDPEAYETLYTNLYRRKEVDQSTLLSLVTGLKKKETGHLRWNYPEDKTYPCNVTLHTLPADFRHYFGEALWHLLYSVTDPQEIRSALARFAGRHGLEADAVVAGLSKVTFKEKGYAAFSAKALKKLLPLMRQGSSWSFEAIDDATRKGIERYCAGTEDEWLIPCRREVCKGRRTPDDFQGLSLSQASYLVYGRHSETDDTERWNTPEQIDDFIRKQFHSGALRNPIVEKVVGETLRVVRDLWKTYGPIDEIHLEMAREMKKNSEARKRDSNRNAENERANHRARVLLQEFAKPEYAIADVRPYSPSQLELFRIYEQGILDQYGDALKNDKELQSIFDALGKPAQSSTLTFRQIQKYRLWMEQKYCSPYTGRPIPLSALFTADYEIEHIIPQARYYDDSMRNKVVCESEVNRDKKAMTGYEYILKEGGKIVQGSKGRTFEILKQKAYEDLVKSHYHRNPAKMRYLLMEDIPENFTNRDMTNTQYIARTVLSLLSKAVRDADEVTAISKHVLAPNGTITTRLKQDWGLHEVWNRLISPRFERMNQLENTQAWGSVRCVDGKRFFQPSQPLHLPAINRKRIDHRHHAMDALVIACADRNHINYLNFRSSHGREEEKYGLRQLLIDKDTKGFKKPWPTFTQDAAEALASIVISFKPNLRIVSRLANGSLGIRKSLNASTYHGKVMLTGRKSVSLKEALKDWHHIVDRNLRGEIRRLSDEGDGYDARRIEHHFKEREYRFGNQDIRRVEVFSQESYSALRTPLDSSFNEKKINSVTDSGIRSILLRHLHQEIYRDNAGDYSPALAFSPEGITALNEHLTELNGGKPHKPIYKVRTTEALGMKFPVGAKGVKGKQYVEAAKGTNLFFGIYLTPSGKRTYATIPFRTVIDRLKQKSAPVPETAEDGSRLLFSLSPGDLVYLPAPGEQPRIGNLNPLRIYKMVSSNKKQCYFIPHTIAQVLDNGKEYGSLNKVEKTDDKQSIKDECLKLQVNRLGQITAITGGER